MTIKSFFDELDERLAASGAEELREILRAMAREVPPSGRSAFLKKLSSPKAVLAVSPVPSCDLLARIGSLAAELAEASQSGDDWYETNSWDSYDDDEDGLAQFEEYVPDLADLFEQAQAAFDYGNLELARLAYQALFPLLGIEDDYGHGIREYDLEGFESSAAYLRYLRAVYETLSLESRSAGLFDAMLEVRKRFARAKVSLEGLCCVRSAPLPERELFLTRWMALLKGQVGPLAEGLLREAVGLSEGVAGLEKLAREEGETRPRVYLDWLKALEVEGRHREVLSAAQEILKVLPQRLPIRAAVADHVCKAAARLKDVPTLRSARWEAFFAKPVLERLLDLREVTPEGERLTLMGRALEHIRAFQAQTSQDPIFDFNQDDDLELRSCVGRNTLAHACLLAGGWREAMREASSEESLGWSSPENIQSLILGFFLVKLAGQLSAVRQFWKEQLFGGVYSWEEPKADPDRLEAAYGEVLAGIAWDKGQQEELITWCREIVAKRVCAIVGGQHRGSYGKAAALAALMATVLRSLGKADRADALIKSLRETFPRHRAFLGELNIELGRVPR